MHPTVKPKTVAIVQVSTCINHAGNIIIHGIDRNGIVYQYFRKKWRPLPNEIGANEKES